jgi:hypothetical protein
MGCCCKLRLMSPRVMCDADAHVDAHAQLFFLSLPKDAHVCRGAWADYLRGRDMLAADYCRAR